MGVPATCISSSLPFSSPSLLRPALCPTLSALITPWLAHTARIAALTAALHLFAFERPLSTRQYYLNAYNMEVCA